MILLVNLSEMEFALLQKYIEEQCGITISADKAYLIESRLYKLVLDAGLDSFEKFYRLLQSRRDPQMVAKVIDAITTNETLWFRDKTPWEILEKVFLPKYIEELQSRKRHKVRIWSAACSTGQEPYSIAMSIARYLAIHNITDVKLSDFEILATDISQGVLEVAIAGRYDNISIMRGLDIVYRDQYFTNAGRVWTLRDDIKRAVQFRPFNLQDSFMKWGMFDLICCRYVAIYFSEKFKGELFEKIKGALHQDGALFLGSSEVFTTYRQWFELEQYNNGIYYRLRR